VRASEFISEAKKKAVKTRLDPKCWKDKKIGNPKTKVKGGVRVNNCVPVEESTDESIAKNQRAAGQEGPNFKSKKRTKPLLTSPVNSTDNINKGKLVGGC
jgi:hypothetical protein